MEFLKSYTTKIPTGYGNMYVTIAEDDSGKPRHVFCTIGKSGASIMAKAEVVGRLVSLALRNDVPIADIVNQLIDIGGKPVPYKDGQVKSIPDAVGKILKRRYIEGEENGKD